GQPRATLRGHNQPVGWVSFSRDGRTLASASADGMVRLWEPGSGQVRSAFLVVRGGEFLGCLDFSPDGKTLASASTDGPVRLWDVQSGAERATLQGHTDRVWDVAFSPDGKTLASASADGTVKLWDVLTGQERLSLNGH